METDDGGVPVAVADQSRAAGDLLERSLLKAVSAMETELNRVVRSSGDELDRLAKAFLETLAKAAIEGAFGGGQQQVAGGDGVSSLNQVAASVAKAVARGVRFT